MTAEGYLVPPGDIPRYQRIAVSREIWEQAAFNRADTTTVKGEKAMRVIKWLLRNGRFPLWAEPTIIDDVDMQFEGADIVVKMAARIQVKCDYDGGTREEGGTGNLYLQVSECNPYKRH